MDLQQLLPWLLAANTLLSLGTAVYALMSAGGKKTASDLATFQTSQSQRLRDVDKLLDAHDSRIQALEGEFKHLPDRDMVHAMQITMKDIQIELAGVKASTETAARTSRRVEEFLLEQAKAGA